MPLDSWQTRVLPDISDKNEFPVPQTAEEAVRNGAKLLDATTPNWGRRIDLDRLDIAHPERCMLGQLYSYASKRKGMRYGYEAGLAALGFGKSPAFCRAPESFGFNIDKPLVTNEALVEAWREQIALRQ